MIGDQKIEEGHIVTGRWVSPGLYSFTFMGAALVPAAAAFHQYAGMLFGVVNVLSFVLMHILSANLAIKVVELEDGDDE